MEFNTRIEKVTIINSQSVSAETIGSWRAGLNSPLQIKDSSSMKNFSAVTVYRIVTVLVINHVLSQKKPVLFFVLLLCPSKKDFANQWILVCVLF